uniref:Uncharacterized protein n=1 Tax=Melopsittacus undulatus TaxID=13146 RepID=A0A8V5GX46_MELUD
MAAVRVEVSVLPDSVLLQILALLPPWDRLRAAGVCRRWRRLALDRAVWKHVDLSQRRVWGTPLLRRVLPAGLSTLRARGCLLSASRQRLLSPALLSALGKRCPQLRCLALSETDLRRIPYASVPASLTALELRRCELPISWFHPMAPSGTLRRLLLHHVPAFADWHLMAASCQHPLRVLSLRGTHRVTEAGLLQAAPQLKGLRHLELWGCGAGDATMGAIGSHMKQLRVLEVVDCPVSSAGLGPLKSLQGLERLCLELGEKVAPKAVIALAQALPRLRELQIVGACSGMDEIRLSLSHCSCSHSPQAPD